MKQTAEHLPVHTIAENKAQKELEQFTTSSAGKRLLEEWQQVEDQRVHYEKLATEKRKPIEAAMKDKPLTFDEFNGCVETAIYSLTSEVRQQIDQKLTEVILRVLSSSGDNELDKVVKELTDVDI